MAFYTISLKFFKRHQDQNKLSIQIQWLDLAKVKPSGKTKGCCRGPGPSGVASGHAFLWKLITKLYLTTLNSNVNFTVVILLYINPFPISSRHSVKFYIDIKITLSYKSPQLSLYGLSLSWQEPHGSAVFMADSTTGLSVTAKVLPESRMNTLGPALVSIFARNAFPLKYFG